MKKCSLKGKHAILILLSVLAAISVVPVRAEDEYHLIASLQAPEPESNAKFGISVAVSKDILVVVEYMAGVEGNP